MSEHIREQLKILKRRGTPNTDPRVVALNRQLEREKQAVNSAQEVTGNLKTVLRELVKE